MELWDLYTNEREKTGLVMKRGEPMPEGYCRLVKNELVRKDLDSANQALTRMKRDWSQTEEYVLLNIEYLELMNKGNEIKRFIKKVNESPIFLSSQTKEVLAFWTD